MPLPGSNPPRSVADRIGNKCSPSWNSRLFSRYGVDFATQAPLMLSLTKARQDFGLGIYQTKATGGPNEIIPAFVDEPLQPQAMRDARGIEFQFMPSPTERKRHGAWRGDWTPTLPPDIVHATEITDRLALARQTSNRPDVVIGAAIAAANVAEDVRYFIDCGFDYVCLILDGCYDAAPAHRVSLASAGEAVENAMAAREQSQRPGFGIRIAAHASPQQVAQWLRSGIDAVSIDAWIQDRAPAAAAPVESFAGILIDTSRNAAGNGEWLYGVIRDYLAELQSEQRFLDG